MWQAVLRIDLLSIYGRDCKWCHYKGAISEAVNNCKQGFPSIISSSCCLKKRWEGVLPTEREEKLYKKSCPGMKCCLGVCVCAYGEWFGISLCMCAPSSPS